MEEWDIETLPIYPEFRDASHPTTSKILSAFEGISFYTSENGASNKGISRFIDTNTTANSEPIRNHLRLLLGTVHSSLKVKKPVNLDFNLRKMRGMYLRLFNLFAPLNQYIIGGNRIATAQFAARKKQLSKSTLFSGTTLF